ncbi:DUF1992 domain-containing protein [Pullulanibacillus camelliae]|uniref:DUF1992 domain-containing protein n=1 Tax=Pullulanibacillus camelliae TaxID=1707096 RepID=A0A8J2YIB0_9BACL|nr:DnaJ family domain-containing protein [Pullulanibacillus camelliae]GGE44997.1 DUF1992 domain-containing protein [Pullulanibacillus camelliae]
MDIIGMIAEDKIKRAMEKGVFDDLPGKGKPLELEDLSAIPPELRMGYKLLKNAGLITDEKQLNKEILSLRDLLKVCEDPSERHTLQKKLNEKTLMLEKLVHGKQLDQNPSYRRYEEQVNQKIK